MCVKLLFATLSGFKSGALWEICRRVTGWMSSPLFRLEIYRSNVPKHHFYAQQQLLL